MMTLYLDATTRVLRCSTREGMPPLDPSLIGGTVTFEVTDEVWLETYQPFLDQAVTLGMDVAVAADGSVSFTNHVPQAPELRRQQLAQFVSKPNPTAADVALALRRLILEVLS